MGSVIYSKATEKQKSHKTCLTKHTVYITPHHATGY